MMRVADYITNALYEAGGETVFLVTGGMIMHLTDALVQHEKQQYICCHHEQAAAMAAEAFGRYTGKLGVSYVTAGPGALNAITGIAGAYVDSAPCIVVGGQSKVALAMIKGPRQFQLQGFDSLPMFKHITKYSVMLSDITRVRYEVEKCIYLATTGRVGPVYLEVPVDLQGAMFDPNEYEGYIPDDQQKQKTDLETLDEKIRQVKAALLKARRPCVLAGAGIRHSGAIEQLHHFIQQTRIPTLTSRLGMDLIDHENPYFVGRPGTYGDRPANFTVQNADLLLVIGCRLGVGLVGYDYQDFAPRALKIMVDVDELELKKPSVVPDIAVLSDAREFLTRLIDCMGDYRLDNESWVTQTQRWKDHYPVDLPEYLNEQQGINSYHFMNVFSRKMSSDDTFVLDTGSCFHVHAQAFQVKYGQRHVITGGLSTMGYAPAAMGVCLATSRKPVYCITGDGSIMMNLQELQTVSGNALPIKFVVLNNNGYLLIRHTQRNFMAGRMIGESPDSGLPLPDLQKIAYAFDIRYLRITNLEELDQKLDELVKCEGPVICEVMTPPDQLLMPRVASRQLDDGRMVSMPYDDMFPFLSREEYEENCVYDKIL